MRADDHDSGLRLEPEFDFDVARDTLCRLDRLALHGVTGFRERFLDVGRGGFVRGGVIQVVLARCDRLHVIAQTPRERTLFLRQGCERSRPRAARRHDHPSQ